MEQVVELALQRLRERKRPSVISGARNRLFAGMARILTRKSLVTMSGSMM